MTTDADSEAGTAPSALALTQAAFEALPKQTAILDDRGDIVWTNEAWERFAREDGLDGTGIPETARTQLFETGFKGERSSGSGLGLTIVERIADAHGWTVAVTDSDSGGARFEFSDADLVDGTSDGGQ